MVHAGLPTLWVGIVLLGMGVLLLYTLLAAPPQARSYSRGFLPLKTVPISGFILRHLTRSPWPLVGLRIVTVLFFLLVIASGLWGTPIPERNLATPFTWTLWWTLVIIAVVFWGSTWCALCPWDALAVWLTRRRLWRRGTEDDGMGWRLPRWLRNVWPAMVLFIGLTWLELGLGVTTNPAATAMLALFMLVLATFFLALFERKSFCRYLCPVGRTIGCYAQLAPIQWRPFDQELCLACTSMECYHGSENIEPCPTFLTMGRFSQNTYCLSCGACVQSCPHDNVTLWLRPMAHEATTGARPHGDEAWFMLVLLALTTFHGITMIPAWEEGLRAIAPHLGDKGALLLTFTYGMSFCLAIPLLLYALTVFITKRMSRLPISFARLFAQFSFATLPVAFACHLAHNLAHLSRETYGIGTLLLNPLGIGTLPLSTVERYARVFNPLLPETWLYPVQSILLLAGFAMATLILRHRGLGMGIQGQALTGIALLPMLLFLAGGTAFNVWLLAQDMVMRM